jgi:hypothetical protein
LAEFRDECDFVAGLSVFVDQERLIWVRNVLVVSGLVVILVGDLLKERLV